MQKTQIHSFKISQDPDVLKFDTTKIVLTKAAEWSGNYTLAMAKPADENGDINLYKAIGITTGGSAMNLKDKIAGFYREVWGSDIRVEEECFDAADQLLIDEETGMQDCDKASISEAVDYCIDINDEIIDCSSSDVAEEIKSTVSTELIESKIYTVTVLKSITAPSCESVIVAGNYGGNIEVILPNEEDGTTSSSPLSGSFFIICYDFNDIPHYTDKLGWWVNEHHIREALIKACPFLRDSITVNH